MNSCSVSSEKQSKNLSYLAIGDSYTIGESVGEDERYPHQLVDTLFSNGLEMAKPEIIAKTGWTSAELLAALDTSSIQIPYSMVTLLIGVNNQYRGQDINIFRKEFETLLNKSVSYAGGIPDHVLVLSIPDWGVTPFANGRNTAQIKTEIDQYNSINKSLSIGAGVRYIDVTGISRKADTDTSLIAYDGLHPSGKMYKEWVEIMLPEVMKILKE